MIDLARLRGLVERANPGNVAILPPGEDDSREGAIVGFPTDIGGESIAEFIDGMPWGESRSKDDAAFFVWCMNHRVELLAAAEVAEAAMRYRACMCQGGGGCPLHDGGAFPPNGFVYERDHFDATLAKYRALRKEAP